MYNTLIFHLIQETIFENIVAHLKRYFTFYNMQFFKSSETGLFKGGKG